MHSNWFGDYALLEKHNSWVYWLFPIREQAPDWNAQPLTIYEREDILKDPACLVKLLTSYKLAMDFFGFTLVDVSTGQLGRTANCVDRFANLNTKQHNFLRLNRIIKWLGEFNLTHYQPELIRALARATFEPPRHLWDMRKSLREFFVRLIKDENERSQLSGAVTQLEAAATKQKRGGAREHFAMTEALRFLESIGGGVA